MNDAQKKEREPKRPPRHALDIGILYRAEIFLAVLSISLSLLYFAGAWQSFLDSTLSMILGLLSVTALADVFLSLVAIAREALALFSQKRKARLSVLISSILILIFSSLILFISHALIAVSEGF